MWAVHYDVTVLITFKTPNVGTMSCYVIMFLALETSILVICHHVDQDGGVLVVVSCCTAFSFSTSDIASLRVCGPFSYMQVVKLWTFLKPLMNILIVATSFMKLHLLASVLNWCTYAARDSLSHCWISMNHEVHVWISALQCFSLNRSLISSHDLFEEITSMISVCIKPHDFTLASLALFSLVRSAAISMPMSQSSNLVESCSLKTGIFCNKEFVRLDYFCKEHKLSTYWHNTSPKGLAGAGGCG